MLRIEHAPTSVVGIREDPSRAIGGTELLGVAVAAGPVDVEAPALGDGEDPLHPESPTARISPRPARPIFLVENIISDSHDDPVSGYCPALEPDDVCLFERNAAPGGDPVGMKEDRETGIHLDG